MPTSRLSCPPPICPSRLPLCHSRESGNPESFPHPPRAGEGGGWGTGVIGPSICKALPGRESAGVRVQEWSSPLSCDTVGFLLPFAPHTLKTLRMSETLWVVGVAQG